MLDAKKLLDQFLGTQTVQRRPGSYGASGQYRSGGSSVENSIGKALGGALGGGAQGRRAPGARPFPERSRVVSPPIS